MRVPVILLNYNSASDCRKCVSFLKRQQGVELEIIIVDNCSREDDRNDVERLCQKQGCTFIPATKNRGYNAGNNIGLRYAAEKGYKYAMIANPDMEFPQVDYIAKLVSAMEKNDEVVVCGSDIIGVDGRKHNPMIRDGNWTSSFNWVKSLFGSRANENGIDNSQESHYCSKLSGCCFLIRFDFLQTIGFFDEGVFLYCEEPILSRQVEFAQKKMLYIADSQAIHAHIASEKGDPVQRFKNWGKSRQYFIEHYSGDSWIGKKIATLSMTLYVFTFILKSKLRK